ncbi:unnamed protein product [Moneuplotes crassus]|uniref:Uncharacterized protein n=1 Tax=Euplotes crassus TaxID=5936 RepID=A0AAD1U8U9_EUPCR|nr:unnamed protein product [Moneuplotes crassus]
MKLFFLHTKRRIQNVPIFQDKSAMQQTFGKEVQMKDFSKILKVSRLCGSSLKFPFDKKIKAKEKPQPENMEGCDNAKQSNQKDDALFTFGTSFGIKAEDSKKKNCNIENKHTPSTKQSSSREKYRQNSQAALKELNQKIQWRKQQISSRRLKENSSDDIKIPEIRFASQGRKKRRQPVNFRRNGPRIARNVFISNCVSFSRGNNNRRGLPNSNKPGLSGVDDSYCYQENNSMANIILPVLNDDTPEAGSSFSNVPVLDKNFEGYIKERNFSKESNRGDKKGYFGNLEPPTNSSFISNVNLRNLSYIEKKNFQIKDTKRGLLSNKGTEEKVCEYCGYKKQEGEIQKCRCNIHFHINHTKDWKRFLNSNDKPFTTKMEYRVLKDRQNRIQIPRNKRINIPRNGQNCILEGKDIILNKKQQKIFKRVLSGKSRAKPQMPIISNGVYIRSQKRYRNDPSHFRDFSPESMIFHS